MSTQEIVQFQRLRLDALYRSHREVLGRAITRILFTDIALETFAPIIDPPSLYKVSVTNYENKVDPSIQGSLHQLTGLKDSSHRACRCLYPPNCCNAIRYEHQSS